MASFFALLALYGAGRLQVGRRVRRPDSRTRLGHYTEIAAAASADMPVFLPGIGELRTLDATRVTRQTTRRVRQRRPLAGSLGADICASYWNRRLPACEAVCEGIRSTQHVESHPNLDPRRAKQPDALSKARRLF